MATGRGRARQPGVRRHDPGELRRGRWARGPVFRTGKLVPWRRGADAVHHVALWRAEPGAAPVSAGDAARRSGPRVEAVRPGAAHAARRLVQGALASPRDGHPRGRGRPARHLRRPHGRSHRRRHDPAHAQRPGVVSRRPLARQHAYQRSGALAHGVVRRFCGAEPGGLQLRAANGPAGDRRPTVRRDRTYPALRLQAGHRQHRGWRTQHGRRQPQLRRTHLRLVRPFPEGRGQSHPRNSAPSTVLHHGDEPVAIRGHLAAARRPAPDALPGGRGQGQYPGWRWRAGPRIARDRPPRFVHLRPREPRAVPRRQRVLHRQRHRRRRLRPAHAGSAARHSGLHLAAAQRGDRGQRAD